MVLNNLITVRRERNKNRHSSLCNANLSTNIVTAAHCGAKCSNKVLSAFKTRYYRLVYYSSQ